jgi:guanine deaminase
MTTEHFMRQAIQLSIANVADNLGGPFAALVVKDNQIIARGTNQVTSTNDPTAHAEIVAIRNACKVLNDFQLKDCVLYSSCEPCPMCLGAIFWARPQMVYFGATRQDAAQAGFDDSFIYNQLEIVPEKRSIPCISLLREDAQDAFKLWKESTIKIRY